MKPRNHASLALYPGVRDSTDLFAVEIVPPAALVLVNEGHNGPELDEIYEGVSNVALVLEVNREIEEVVGSTEVRVIDFVQHRCLCVLVWDVADHDRGPPVDPLRHEFQSEAVVHRWS